MTDKTETSEETNQFSKEFQFSLLNLFLQDSNVFQKASKFIEKNNPFESEMFFFFYEIIYDYFKEYRDVPDETAVTQEINNLGESENKKRYLKFYQQIKETKYNRDYILDQLEPFIKAYYFAKAYDDMPEKYNKNPGEAYIALNKLVDDLNSINFEDDNYFTLEDYWEEVKKENELDTRSVAKTGINEIDKKLRGGVRAGEILTFLARDGVGKSMCLMNIGALALQAGQKVLHIHCEGKINQPIFRYMARLSGVTINSIKDQNLTDEEIKKVKETITLCKENLIIQPFLSTGKKQSFGVNIEDLQGLCSDIYERFPFDVLIVDYGDKLGTRMPTESTRFVSDFVWRGLEEIGSKFQVPVFTATQSVRVKSDSQKVLVKEDSSESMYKSRLSSYIITINKSSSDAKDNYIRFYLAKNREEEADLYIKCKSDFSRGITHYTENQMEQDRDNE